MNLAGATILPPVVNPRAITELPPTELAQCQAELARYKEAVRQATVVCGEAARGNLEPRLLHIHAEGELGDMLRSINHLLDLTDAYVREAGTCLAYASEDKFFRKVLTRGLLGCFRAARGCSILRRPSWPAGQPA